MKLRQRIKDDDQLLILGLFILFLIGIVFVVMDLKTSVFSYDPAQETQDIKTEILQRLETVELEEINRLLEKLALIENTLENTTS